MKPKACEADLPQIKKDGRNAIMRGQHCLSNGQEKNNTGILRSILCPCYMKWAVLERPKLPRLIEGETDKLTWPVSVKETETIIISQTTKSNRLKWSTGEFFPQVQGTNPGPCLCHASTVPPSCNPALYWQVLPGF
jgi:hypothetical protein